MKIDTEYMVREMTCGSCKSTTPHPSEAGWTRDHRHNTGPAIWYCKSCWPMMEGGDWYLNVLKEDVIKAAKAWAKDFLGGHPPHNVFDIDLANAVGDLMDFQGEELPNEDAR